MAEQLNPGGASLHRDGSWQDQLAASRDSRGAIGSPPRMLAGATRAPQSRARARARTLCNAIVGESDGWVYNVQVPFNICRWVTMPLTLPAPDRTVLPGTPLELVVCQIRFDEQVHIGRPEFAAKLHERFGGSDGAYSQIEEIASESVNFVQLPDGQHSVSQSGRVLQGWRLRSSDGAWVVVFARDHVALETPRYPGWDDFSARMAEVLDILTELAPPNLEYRIGLRYVDRISLPDARTTEAWKGYVAPELLGICMHETLGPQVVTSRQQLALDLEGGFGCTLTHGFIPENNALDYLLDYDLFRQGGRAFDAASIKEAVATLNSDALKLFQASITPAMFDRLRAT